MLHVSWLNIERKLKHYRAYWHRYHASVYKLSEDQNTMFPKPWSEVTDEEIHDLAESLKEAGPRFFHHPIDLTQRGAVTPYRGVVPENVLEWDRSVSRTSVGVDPDLSMSVPEMIEALRASKFKLH